MKDILRQTIWLSVVVMLACANPAVAAEHEHDPADVAAALAGAQNAGSLDGAAGLFAEDAVVIDPSEQAWVGRRQVRRWFAEAFGPTFRRDLLGTREVMGDSVTWTDEVSDAGYRALRMETLAQVRDGQIRLLTYRYLPREAESRQTQPAPPHGVLLPLLIGIVAILALWWRPAATFSSRPAPGHMMAALRRSRSSGTARGVDADAEARDTERFTATGLGLLDPPAPRLRA